MILKRKKVLLSLGAIITTLFLGAINGAGKMLATDLWPSISPLISTAWTWAVAALAWMAQPITAPLWLLVAAFVAAVVVVAFFLGFIRELSGSVRFLRDRQNPSLPHLNEATQKVLTVIAQNAERDIPTYASELYRLVELSRLACDAAIDSLRRESFIEIFPSSWGDEVALSSRGRAYILHPKSPLAEIVKTA